MTNATIAVGGIIGLVLTVPLAASLIPESLIDPSKSSGGTWADLTPDQMKQLASATDAPVKITFTYQYQDGYLPPANDTHYVWGVKLSPQMMADFQASRPDLFTATGKVPYDAYDKQLGFTLFSSVCPHLGCPFNWDSDQKKFVCPCHGSKYSLVGERLEGPTQRGLDPMPFRDQNGKAQVTWIQYKAQQPDRVVVSYN